MDSANTKTPDFIHSFIYSTLLGKHFVVNTNVTTPATIELCANTLIDFINTFKWIDYRIIDCNSTDENYFIQQLSLLQATHEISTNKHEILIIIPSLSNTENDGIKIAYFLQCLNKLSKKKKPTGKQYTAICVTNMDFLNKNQYLYKQFWLNCSLESFLSQVYNNRDIHLENLNEYYLNFLKTWTCIQNSGNHLDFVSFLIRQYILDIVIHLRLHRFSVQGKGGGVQTSSLNDMILLSKLMAITPRVYEKLYAQSSSDEEHETDMDCYIVTPDLIKSASFWYFPFKLQLSISNEHLAHKNFIKDPSILYGSDKTLVDDLCSKLGDLHVMKQKQYKKQQSGGNSKDESEHQQQHGTSHITQDEADFFLQQLVVKDVLNNVVPPF